MNHKCWPHVKKRINRSIRREIARLQRIQRRDVLVTPLWFRQRETGVSHVHPLRETYCIGTRTRHRVSDAINWRRTMLENLRWMPTYEVFPFMHVTEQGQSDPILVWVDKNHLSRVSFAPPQPRP